MNKLNITDVNACYKNESDSVKALLEIEVNNKFELIFSYDITKNTINVYKELNLWDINTLIGFIKKDKRYEGIFKLYFKVYQNDYDDLKSVAINFMNDLNNTSIKKESTLKRIKKAPTTLWKALWNELPGELDEVIKDVALNKKIWDQNDYKHINRTTIEITRYKSKSWNSIYEHEFGKYKEEEDVIIDRVNIYKVLPDDEIYRIISLLNTTEEFEIFKEYLKLKPKEKYDHSKGFKKRERIVLNDAIKLE